jgi:hypothetical protein
MGSALEGAQLLAQALQEQESSEGWNDWACAMMKLERYQEAESGFRRALILDGKNSQAVRNLVGLMEQFSRYYQEQRDGLNRQQLTAQLERLRAAQPAAPSQAGRNLVMGVATGYDRKALAPFVCSLRKAGYQGDVVLFVNQLDAETAKFLEDHRVWAEPWDGMFLPFDLLLGRNVTFYNFLVRPETALRGPYSHVLLTDVRDVFFQADPFLPAPETELEFFLEDDSRRVGNCSFNSTWVRMAFGEQVLREMGERRISCAGTVLGTWRGILEYLLHMQILATQAKPTARFVKGVDQGLHNLLLHRNLLDSSAVAENGARVFTLGYVGETGIRMTEDGRVADLHGRVSPLVHQYDRHPGLAERVRRLDVGNGRAEVQLTYIALCGGG